MTSKKNSEIILDYDAAGMPVSAINPQPAIPDKSEAKNSLTNTLGPDFLSGNDSTQQGHKSDGSGADPGTDPRKIYPNPFPVDNSYVSDSEYLPEGKK